MNTTIRNLIVALPLAAAAVTMAPAAALASDGPIIVQPSDPGPHGPGDITNPEPGPVDPTGPGDLTAPTPGPSHPNGPGDLTAPQPCPTHGVKCGGNGGGTNGGGTNGGDGSGTDGGGQGTGKQAHTVGSIALPTRVDAGVASAPSTGDTGLELAWLLAGGAVVTASGAASAAGRKARARA